MRREDNHSSTSQGKSSKGAWENNFASSAENQDTGQRDAQLRQNSSIHKYDPVNGTRGQAHGNRNNNSEKSTLNRYPSSGEMKKVPSKRWAEGQTRAKTHHHGKLLCGTQLHGKTRKRPRPYYGQSTTPGRERDSYYQRNGRLRSNRRLYRQRSLQETRDQNDQSEESKGDLPGGWKTKRYGPCYPYGGSTYGHQQP